MENTISSSNNPENSATHCVGLSGESISQEQTVKVQASYLISKPDAVVAKVTNQNFICNICGSCFPDIARLKIHEKFHKEKNPFQFNDRKKTYTCQICSKSFAVYSELMQHRKIHTDPKPFKCNSCTQEFIRKGHLQTHMRTHTKERPYECQTCSGTFRSISNLNAHKKKHETERLFKCNDSGRDFFRKESLNSHQKNKVCKGSEKPVSDKQVTSTEQIHAQVQMQTVGNFIATGATPFYQFQPEKTKNLEESVGFGQDQAVSTTRLSTLPMPTLSSARELSLGECIKIKKRKKETGVEMETEMDTRDKVSLPVLSTLPMEQGYVYSTMLENPQVEGNSEKPLDLSLPKISQNSMPQTSQNSMPQTSQNSLPKTSQNSMPKTSQNSSFHRPWERSTSHATEDLSPRASASGNPARYMPYQQIETSQTSYAVQNGTNFLC